MTAHPHIELRLYNLFSLGRDRPWLRLGGLLADFDRLNRRMHNKLLNADGRAAIVGGAHPVRRLLHAQRGGQFPRLRPALRRRGGARAGGPLRHFLEQPALTR